jgi:hypothetical protein
LRGHRAESDPRIRAALHAGELHGYGLLSPEEFTEARNPLRGVTDPDRLADWQARNAARDALAVNPHNTWNYPPDSARVAWGDRVVRERTRQAHLLSTHRLREYALANPPPADTPARLSRPAETVRRLDRKRQWISWKVKKIMDEGVRGKPVDQKQAVAIAYSMWKEKHGQ